MALRKSTATSSNTIVASVAGARRLNVVDHVEPGPGEVIRRNTRSRRLGAEPPPLAHQPRHQLAVLSRGVGHVHSDRLVAEVAAVGLELRIKATKTLRLSRSVPQRRPGTAPLASAWIRSSSSRLIRPTVRH
jgi:hypothetical protein